MFVRAAYRSEAGKAVQFDAIHPDRYHGRTQHLSLMAYSMTTVGAKASSSDMTAGPVGQMRFD